MEEREVGFIELLRVNPVFRRYWGANAVSMLGEWFNTVALFVLIDAMSGSSELALGVLFILRMFALAFPQLLTGVLADRYSRKWLMVLANLLSAVAVGSLLFLPADGPIWYVYAVAAVLQLLHAVYVPAENAAIPNITKPNELLTANALNSGTWSASLAIGASLGGFVVAAYGVQVAFITNVAAFLFAAAVIATIDIPQRTEEKPDGSFIASSLSQIAHGIRIIWTTPPIYRVITAKALWGVFGGGLIYMLILMGADIGLGDIAAGIGVLFGARGIGTGLGPILARYLFTDRSRWPYLLGWLVSTCGLAYTVIAFMEWSALITIFVVCAHAASGANWVLSTVLLQERSEDEWRGRVFSVDFLLMTFVYASSALVASLLLEYTDLTLRTTVQMFAIGQLLSGFVWVALVTPGERRDALAAEGVVGDAES
ncbi:MAG: MFS transporter [Candidatus Poseidoniales archaeon]|nr:MFS transporter [Candidatus Poseidoniales archaeon]